jgi:trigger factor
MEQEVAVQARRVNARFTREQAQNLMSQLHADAEKKVRAGLLMAAIAKKLEIKITEEDIEQAYIELAEETGKNVAKVKVEYREAQKRQLLIGMILEDKLLDLLESKSIITDGPADPVSSSPTAEVAAT